MTSQGSAHGRFTRAIQTRNLWAAETAMREMGTVSLADALDYLGLLAAARPERFDRAAVRWHGRLETEAAVLTFAGGERENRRAARSSSLVRQRDLQAFTARGLARLAAGPDGRRCPIGM
jgi:hypothetical protein